MTQQVLYSTATAQVLQWQDTGQFSYGAAPSGTATLPVTVAEWANQAGAWYVVGGALTQTDPNAPTAAQLLAQAQATQIPIITQACAAAITSGFTSSALGSAHTYPSGLTDQANLAANVVSSLLPGLPSTWTTPQLCCDANGVWAYVAHTAAQIQQVGSDGKAAILASLTKKASLQAEIEAATTIAAVQAIVW